MKLSLVLIIYRSDSSIALEASKFCEEVLKAKILNQTGLQVIFIEMKLKNIFIIQNFNQILESFLVEMEPF